jgi:signal transduction histidine kinase
LVHDLAVLDDRELIDSVAAATRIAVSNVRLQFEIRGQVEQLVASRRRIVNAGDTQRRKVELELREGAERRLASVRALLEDSCFDAEHDSGFAEMLAETRRQVELAQDEVREFARGVHPRVLVEEGLPAALAELVRRSPVPVELHAANERYSPTLEAAVYFVCSEALANIGKYAEASQAEIDAVQHDGRLVVVVHDDGIGGANFDAGRGLRGLADRVEALGGRLSLTSPPGGGTLVLAELPLS